MSPSTYPFAAVLFDLDGIVIDTTELHYRVWDEFARAHKYHPSRAELLATNGRRAGETVRMWLGNGLDEQEVAALTADREAHFNRLLATEPVSAVPGVEAFVAALITAGIPRAVATSAVPANAELSLARVAMTGKFDAVITAADVHRGKPDPEPYLKAAAALGADPKRCVVIEDSVSGIRAAGAAGARCLAMATTFPREQLEDEEPDWLVSTFLDLPPQFWPAAVV
jgi:HAD superfamily hydrolase (TIGR01509 family)